MLILQNIGHEKCLGRKLLHFLKDWQLKGHAHGDFAVFWSKLLKYFPKNLFCFMKLPLPHREENIKTNHSRFLATSLKFTGQCFQAAIHFHPSHPQPNIINISFCALVGLLLTKLNHYFNDSIETNTSFGHS